MSLLEKLFESFGGGDPVPQRAVQPSNPAQLLDQRRALTASLTPEHQARLAQAYAVKQARQRLDQALKTDQGSEAVLAALRNLMRQG